jgi:uncharacterized protein (DUF1778 family)
MGKQPSRRSEDRRKELRPLLREKDGSCTIKIRLSPGLTTVLGATAAIFGESLENYVLRTLRRQARDIGRGSPPLRLSSRDFRRFLNLCEDPSPPNAALRHAAERYKDAIATGRLIVRD